MFHKDHSHGPPCRYMESVLQRAADGSARGIIRWYALAHAARCSRCQRFLDSLREMMAGLRGERDGEPSKEVLDRLSAKISAEGPGTSL